MLGQPGILGVSSGLKCQPCAQDKWESLVPDGTSGEMALQQKAAGGTSRCPEPVEVLKRDAFSCQGNVRYEATLRHRDL